MLCTAHTHGSVGLTTKNHCATNRAMLLSDKPSLVNDVQQGKLPLEACAQDLNLNGQLFPRGCDAQQRATPVVNWVHQLLTLQNQLSQYC